jgi:hypothetical protein
MQNDFDRRDSNQDFDNGIRSSNIGSFIPEGSYRPVPIVWLAAAWILQGVALSIMLMVLNGKMPIFTVLTSAIITFVLGNWTFERGMAQAGTGWKIATVVILLITLALVSAAAYL